MPADLVVLVTDMLVAEDGEIARLSEESFRKLDEVLSPTQARNKTMPISRRARLAPGDRYHISGPILPTRLSTRATMRGPPANPSLTGAGIPGKTIGKLPRITPSKIPTKTGKTCGWSNALGLLPTSSPTCTTPSFDPTTKRKSPNCSRT